MKISKASFCRLTSFVGLSVFLFIGAALLLSGALFLSSRKLSSTLEPSFEMMLFYYSLLSTFVVLVVAILLLLYTVVYYLHPLTSFVQQLRCLGEERGLYLSEGEQPVKEELESLQFLLDFVGTKFEVMTRHYSSYHHRGRRSILFEMLQGGSVEPAGLDTWERVWWTELTDRRFVLFFFVPDDGPKISVNRDLFVESQECRRDFFFQYRWLDGELVVIAVPAKTVSFPVRQWASRMQREMTRGSETRVSVGYSERLFDPGSLDEAATQLRRTALLRYAKGPGKLISLTELESARKIHCPWTKTNEFVRQLYRNETNVAGATAAAIVRGLAVGEYDSFLFCAFLGLFHIKEEIHRRGGDGYFLSAELERILEEPWRLRFLQDLERIFRQMIAAAEAYHRREESSNDAAIVEAAKIIIRESYTDPGLCAAWVADELMLSEETLKKKFRQCETQPLHSYINELRLRQAGRQLRESGETVKSIAAEAGFANYSYFFTLFKQYYGMTPRQYRKREVLDSIDPGLAESDET